MPKLFRRLGPVPGARPTRSSRDEAMRVVRSNLLLALTDLGRPTVIITSPNAGEGKTTTCMGIADTMARAGHRVVVIDFDLRHPNVHLHLGLTSEPGVTDVLLDRSRLSRALRYVTLGQGPRQSDIGLYVLPAGAEVSNPAELLGTVRTSRLLEVLAEQADIVLIDTPPVLPVADTLIVGRMAAGALLVLESRRTTYPAARAAKNALTRNQTRILGVVVNKVDEKDFSYGYGYGYGYGHGYGYGYGREGEGNGAAPAGAVETTMPPGPNGDQPSL